MKSNNKTENKSAAQSENSLVVGYDRIVERITKTSLQTTDTSSHIIREMVDEAIALEQTAEQMTSDELHLLAQYVYRDVKLLSEYLHETGEGLAAWLNFDLSFLEQSAKQQFMELADKTIVENLELSEKIDCSSSQYMAGEICAAGTLRCLSCSEQWQMLETKVIQPCRSCDGHLFERSSKNEQSTTTR